MSNDSPLSPLLSALSSLSDWFTEEHVRGVVIGGVAASLLGRPRLTRDIDALVMLEEARWKNLLHSADKFGFTPRISDPLDFAHKARVLLLTHVTSGIDVDIALGLLSFEEDAVAQAISIAIEGVNIPVPKPEDLVIMKAVAHRPRDLSDIEGVLDAHPETDIDKVREVVSQVAEALEAPEILADLDRVISQRSG